MVNIIAQFPFSRPIQVSPQGPASGGIVQSVHQLLTKATRHRLRWARRVWEYHHITTGIQL